LITLIYTSGWIEKYIWRARPNISVQHLTVRLDNGLSERLITRNEEQECTWIPEPGDSIAGHQ
jgi:hypothetical protein